MPTSRVRSLFAVLAICALLFTSCSRKPEATQTPEEVSSAVFDSVFTLIQQGHVSSRQDFEAARNRIAIGLFGTVSTDSLTGADSLVYGQLLFWSGRNEEAKRIFEDLKAESGEEAQAAFLELITMEVEVGDKTVAEELMTDYRKLYPPGADNKAALYDQCESLGGHYNDMNLLEDAIRLYVDELNSLSFERPFTSFQLLADLTNACQEVEKLDICKAQLLRCKEGLVKGFAEYVKTTTYADSTEQAEDRNPKTYEFYIQNCNELLERINVIGKPAPEIAFMHVYNADSTLTLESLKGKVVLIDFWTTWCIPCVIGFSELRVFFDEYRARGLEIVGVTSLQRYFADMETGEVEKDLESEREIELTGEFIKRKNIVWPCAISEKNIFHNRYTVNSVPTFVLIDREGYVRFIQSFAGQMEQKRRIIERLL